MTGTQSYATFRGKAAWFWNDCATLRAFVVQGAMRSRAVVIVAPPFDLIAGLAGRIGRTLVQAFIWKLAVEAFRSKRCRGDGSRRSFSNDEASI